MWGYCNKYWHQNLKVMCVISVPLAESNWIANLMQTLSNSCLDYPKRVGWANGYLWEIWEWKFVLLNYAYCIMQHVSNNSMLHFCHMTLSHFIYNYLQIMSWSVIIFVIKSHKFAFFIKYCVKCPCFWPQPKINQNRDKNQKLILLPVHSSHCKSKVSICDSILPY